MSEQPDNRPGDVFIPAISGGEALAKYSVAVPVYPFVSTTSSLAPFSHSMTYPTNPVFHFNLTAYVRDMIAGAVK